MCLWHSGRVSVSRTGDSGFKPSNLFKTIIFLSLNSANSVKTFRKNSNKVCKSKVLTERNNFSFLGWVKHYFANLLSWLKETTLYFLVGGRGASLGENGNFSFPQQTLALTFGTRSEWCFTVISRGDWKRSNVFVYNSFCGLYFFLVYASLFLKYSSCGTKNQKFGGGIRTSPSRGSKPEQIKYCEAQWSISDQFGWTFDLGKPVTRS